MVGLGQPVPNPVCLADHIEAHRPGVDTGARSTLEPLAVIRELNFVVQINEPSDEIVIEVDEQGCHFWMSF